MLHDLYNMLIIGGSDYYELFYTFAFILSNLILVIEGVRRNFPLSKWFTLLLFTSFFFLIGTKLFVMDYSTLVSILKGGIVSDSGGRSAFGGLILGGLALYIAIKILKFKENVLDVYALSLPISLGIQKLGCFSAGCCHGVQSDIWWGVSYPTDTMVHFNHYLNELISVSDLYSKPVHPVQLYEFFAGLSVFIIIYLLRNRWTKKGVLFSLTIALYTISRFGNEFFRDPMGHPTGGKVLYVFSNEQWVLLFISIFSFIWFFINRNKANISSEERTEVYELDYKKIYSLLLVALLLLFVFINLFSYLEVIALMTLIVPSVVIFVKNSIQKENLSLLGRLAISGSIVIIPLIVIGQTIPSLEKGVDDKSYFLINTAYGYGNYWSTKELDQTRDNSCGSSYEDGYNEQYNTYALGIAKIKEQSDGTIYGYGANMLYGNHIENYLGATSEVNKIYNVNPYFQYYGKWVGGKIGLHMGKLIVADSETKESKMERGINYKDAFVMPQFTISVFPRRYAFIEYSFYDFYPSSLPAFRYVLALGSGFNKTNGFYVKVGIGSASSTFFKVNYPVGKHFVFDAMYSTKFSEALNSVFGSESERLDKFFSFGVQYKFGYKVEKIPENQYSDNEIELQEQSGL